MYKILLVEDDELLRFTIVEALKEYYNVKSYANPAEALKALERESFDLIITDQKLPEMSGIDFLKLVKEKDFNLDVIVITAFGTVQDAVEAMRFGASDFLQKPFSMDELLRVVQKTIQGKQGSDLVSPKLTVSLITKNEKMLKLVKLCEIISKSDCNVLIEGESGVGKEIFATLIHQLSPRRDGPLIIVNCGAIPDNLLESELFGYEKGAFTGAEKRKMGKIELSNGGTLVLDEISELPLNLQVKLLRALQTRKIERLGSTEQISVDFRLIALSNKILKKQVEAGLFRLDLFYRLNVMPLMIPPLRERPEDIPLLVSFFLKKFCKRPVVCSPEVISALQSYDWPGNVRELQNACERASILLNGNQINSADIFLLPMSKISEVTDLKLGDTDELASQIEVTRVENDETGASLKIKLGMSLAEVEKLLILQTLKSVNGSQKKAAEILGVSTRTLRNKLSEYKQLTSDLSKAPNS